MITLTKFRQIGAKLLTTKNKPKYGKIVRYNNSNEILLSINTYCTTQLVSILKIYFTTLLSPPATLEFPVWYCTINLYGCEAKLQWVNRALFSLRLSSHSKEWWSVWIVNSFPSKYIRNAWIASLIARHSFCTVEYFSLFSSFRLKYAMRCSTPLSLVWLKRTPTPRLDASV